MYMWKNWRWLSLFFFFTCPEYKDARNILFNSIFEIHNLHSVNTHVLLGVTTVLIFLKTNICSLSFKPLSNMVVVLTNLYSEFLFHHDYYFFVSICIYSFFFQNQCNMLYIHVYHICLAMHINFCVLYMYTEENDLSFQNLCSIKC
jgi:hypothetical protein